MTSVTQKVVKIDSLLSILVPSIVTMFMFSLAGLPFLSVAGFAVNMSAAFVGTLLKEVLVSFARGPLSARKAADHYLISVSVFHALVAAAMFAFYLLASGALKPDL